MIVMPINVMLIRADVEQHQLDFEIYDPNAPQRPQRSNNHGKRSFDKGRKNNVNKRNSNTSHVNNGHNFKIRHRKTTAVKSNKK